MSNKLYTEIDAKDIQWLPDFKELYRYRQLLFSLALRDIKVKYSQTFIGFLWALFNPLLSLLVLVFVFDKVVNTDTAGIDPYVFTVVGITVWNYFSILFSEAGTSIIGAQDMVKKIYFPRLVIPMSKAISGLLDLGISFLILIVIFLIKGVEISAQVIYAPVFVLFLILAGWTGGIWMSALSIRFRDVVFIIPFITRLGMFLTPIAYASNSVPEAYRFWMYLNPLTGIIEGFRWSLLGIGEINSMTFYSIGLLLLLFVGGIVFFTRIERSIADII